MTPQQAQTYRRVSAALDPSNRYLYAANVVRQQYWRALADWQTAAHAGQEESEESA